VPIHALLEHSALERSEYALDRAVCEARVNESVILPTYMRQRPMLDARHQLILDVRDDVVEPTRSEDTLQCAQ